VTLDKGQTPDQAQAVFGILVPPLPAPVPPSHPSLPAFHVEGNACCSAQLVLTHPFGQQSAIIAKPQSGFLFVEHFERYGLRRACCGWYETEDACTRKQR
jgi:hypothetical protein